MGVYLVCAFTFFLGVLLTSHSHQLQAGSTIPIPLPSTRYHCGLYVMKCCTSFSVLTYNLDLYLIRPPEGASHLPVNPAHIVVAGDSAGGGLTIALLQVLRDCGLPLPAGAALISPWCDLTHSFPSIHVNTATVSIVCFSCNEVG